jgi:hypothetical protein
LDQTDLKNGVDATLGDGKGVFWKMSVHGAHKGPGDMHVGLSGPTWRWLASLLGGEPPGVI